MDEKEIDLKIEKEMVDLFIVSNRMERGDTKYIVSPSSQCTFILFYLSLHIKALVHKSLDAFNISDICIAMDRVLHNRGSNGKVDNISWLIIVHESINKAG